MDEQEPKETRRFFLEKVVVGGLAASLPILNGGVARADAYSDCLADCYTSYLLCVAAVSDEPWWVKNTWRAGCRTTLLACYTACAASKGLQTVFECATVTADWIKNHPQAVVGTIVIIGTVAFIVVATGGGGVGLVPAAAALL